MPFLHPQREDALCRGDRNPLITHGVIQYFTENGKPSEILLDVRLYRRSDTFRDHVWICAKLRVPPKWLHLQKGSAGKGHLLYCEVRLLNDESIRWLYK